MTEKSKIDIIQLMQLPSRSVINTRISKKTLLDNAELSASDKKLIRDYVMDMNWVAALKTQNSNIPAFIDENEIYDEIHIIHVQLKQEKPYQKVAGLLQKVIPYPLVLLLEYDNHFSINTAVKQINQNDSSKRTIIEHHYSDWFQTNDNPITQQFLNSIHFNKLSHQSLKHYYKGLTDRIINYQSAKLSGIFKEKISKDTAKEKEALNRINEIEYELVTLRSALSKESSFNKKVELNIQIVNLNDEKNRIIQTLD